MRTNTCNENEIGLNTAGDERILVVAGPTCIGKSEYGVKLAKQYGGEVISADSVQVYRGLDIGSGKITLDEMQGIPHHMLDIVDISEPFTVVDFISRAKALISDITARGKLPIIVGGTGFYINALLNGYNCGSTPPNDVLRAKLYEYERINGKGSLHKKLSLLQEAEQAGNPPEAYNPSRRLQEYNDIFQLPEVNDKTSDTCRLPEINDLYRTVRRVEQLLSPKIDSIENSLPFTKLYNALVIVMDAQRNDLVAAADKRIRKMLDAGFENEARKFVDYEDLKPLKSVGYREMITHIQFSEFGIEDTIATMKQSYRDLIKKQQTYFRWMKWDNKIFLTADNRSKVSKAIKEFLSN